MGCHWCADEMFAVFAVLGAVRFIPGWIRARWDARHQKPQCCPQHPHEEK